MAGFQSCPGIVQTVIWAKVGTEECLTIMHWRCTTGAMNLAIVNQITGLVQFNWKQHMVVQMPDTYIASEVRGTLLTLPNDLTGTAAFTGGSGQGGASLPQLSNNVSLAVQHNTGLSGRSARGRTFWPVFSTGDVVGNDVLQLRIDLILDAFAQMRADLLTSNLQHVVLSRWTAKALRPVGISFDVTGYTVKDTTVDSMRRRLPGRGA